MIIILMSPCDVPAFVSRCSCARRMFPIIFRQHADTSATAKPDVYPEICREQVVGKAEGVAQTFLHLVVVGVRDAILAHSIAY